ncbi:DUF5700 domain-containing putative Zn-dependent protease [Fulvivirga lutea]|uniref:Uncharacterized protein n=1 Tax=Fulvivirga lutea TaxID=2810512 RepID=A0A975A267_9BACT|nr:DUF5700 domain-containing putative Zn-dependent protease [Fulvivirga lutea]QSE98965.1 hypothetical protein JR347_07740 [Fulvivirga lutea]
MTLIKPSRWPLFITISLILLACVRPSNNGKSSQYSEYNFTTESAVKAIEIAKLLQANKNVSDEEWESLFNSEGYSNYLIYSNSPSQKREIKAAVETVFNPAYEDKLDSLMNIPLLMDQDYFKLSLIRNFRDLKNNFDKAQIFLESTDFNELITSGDSLARTYLPKRVLDSLPKLYDIHLILSDPDAKVMENAIVFDLNMALNRGTDDLIKIIAHEFHHNYRALTAKRYEHPLMIQLNKIHQEGVADLIDKDEPPIQKLSLYPKTIIDMYNSDYENTPKKLKNLDLLTNTFLNQEIDSLTYYGRLENFFAFGGHTNGFYMSLKIAKKKNLQILIDNYDDPIQFIEIYNEVTQESAGDHVFSSEFIDYLKKIE